MKLLIFVLHKQAIDKVQINYLLTNIYILVFLAIFSNIPILLEVNERLLRELKTSESDGPSGGLRFQGENKDEDNLPSIQSVAEAFLNYAPYLKLYSTYASGFQQSHELLLVK